MTLVASRPYVNALATLARIRKAVVYFFVTVCPSVMFITLTRVASWSNVVAFSVMTWVRLAVINFFIAVFARVAWMTVALIQSQARG